MMSLPKSWLERESSASRTSASYRNGALNDVDAHARERPTSVRPGIGGGSVRLLGEGGDAHRSSTLITPNARASVERHLDAADRHVGAAARRDRRGCFE